MAENKNKYTKTTTKTRVITFHQKKNSDKSKNTVIKCPVCGKKW